MNLLLNFFPKKPQTSLFIYLKQNKEVVQAFQWAENTNIEAWQQLTFTRCNPPNKPGVNAATIPAHSGPEVTGIRSMEQLVTVAPSLEPRVLSWPLHSPDTPLTVLSSQMAVRFQKPCLIVNNTFSFGVFNHLVVLSRVNPLLRQRLQSASQVRSLYPGLTTTSYTQTGNGGQTRSPTFRGCLGPRTRDFGG